VRQSKISGLGAGIVVATLALGAAPALANGGDFFEELALHGLQANPNMGSPYFGFIRDARGRGVNGATLVATVKSSGETKTVRTNILGHYTLDGFNKAVSSDDVEITCEKDGFEQVRVERRVMQDRTLQPVEANCTLTAQTADAS
jgi:hypothetical protein